MMRYEIYQLKDPRCEYAFFDYKSAKDKVRFADYRKVAEGPIHNTKNAPVEQVLEELYMKFNLEKNLEQGIRSLSVSDVVAIYTDTWNGVYYVDTFGFQEMLAGKLPVKQDQKPQAQDNAQEKPQMDPYERFQLQWMVDHGYSLKDLMHALHSMQYDDPEDSDQISTPVNELFDRWEADVGFDSEIWPCRGEWADTEAKLPETTHGLRIPLDDKHVLTVERTPDPLYNKEIFVGIEDNNGCWLQDICVIYPPYQCDDDYKPIYSSDYVTVGLYENPEMDDITQTSKILILKVEPEVQKNSARIEEGMTFWVEGDAQSMGIPDYDVRVSTQATVLETPVDDNNDVFVRLAEIDGEQNVSTTISRTALK